MGVGPLSRAYTKAFALAAQECDKREYVEYTLEVIECEYNQEASVKKQLEDENMPIINIDHLEKVKIYFNKVK